MIRPLTKEDEL